MRESINCKAHLPGLLQWLQSYLRKLLSKTPTIHKKTREAGSNKNKFKHYNRHPIIRATTKLEIIKLRMIGVSCCFAKLYGFCLCSCFGAAAEINKRETSAMLQSHVRRYRTKNAGPLRLSSPTFISPVISPLATKIY